MFILFSTLIVAFCLVIIIKLYQENKKLKNQLLKEREEKEKEKRILEDKQYIKSIRPLIRIPNYNNDSIKTTSPTTTKNGFLFGADNFGTMEKGVVNEGKTYINEQNKDGSFDVSVSFEYAKESLDSDDTEKIQCPQCHLQSHKLNWFEFSSSYGSFQQLAGRKGFYANCPSCDIRVKYIVTKMS